MGVSGELDRDLPGRLPCIPRLIRYRIEVAGRDISRPLIAASSVPLVLSILQEGPSYGYRLIQRARELSGGALEWSEGMLYPVLHRLEAQGLVSSRWERGESGRRRKVYRLAASGRRELAEQRRHWTLIDATLRAAWKGT